jgi:hypothetical protein
LLVSVLAVAGMVSPSSAAAELGNPLGELAGTPQQQQEQSASETSSTSSTTSTGASSISTSTLFLAGGAAVLLLGGIAFLIVRDARSVAPVSEGPTGGVSASDRAAQLRRRRAKAKAGRRQRKRNR